MPLNIRFKTVRRMTDLAMQRSRSAKIAILGHFLVDGREIYLNETDFAIVNYKIFTIFLHLHHFSPYYYNRS